MRDLDSALAAVTAAARGAKSGAWIRGHGIDPSIMLGGAITRARLDALAPDHPVFLMESNGHVAYVNSAALAAAGVDEQTPDPPQGRYCRDGSGQHHRDAWKKGHPTRSFMRLLPATTIEGYTAAVRRVFERASSVGCTTLNDMGLGGSGVGEHKLLRTIMDDDPPIRLDLASWPA